MSVLPLVVIVLGLSVASADTFANPAPSGEITLEEMSLLQPQRQLGCPAPESLNSKNTPPDLYAAIPACVREGKFREGAFLFAMAGVYARYDTFRVDNAAAHRATELMRLQIQLNMDEKKYEDFQAGLRKTLGAPESLAKVCKTITRHGPPSYHPDYMLKFGNAKTPGVKSGLVKEFRSKESFEKSLVSFLRCRNP